MARLETLLSEAGIGSNESSKIEALRKEVARLRKALAVPEARKGAIGPRPAETRRRRTALERSPDQKDTIRTLRKDITRLNNEAVRRDKQILQLNKHALDEWHRHPELAGRLARSVRGERSQTTGRPVAVAAMVDERGAQARTHGAGVTGAIECRYYGRDFSAGEMALLRALIAGPPPLNRHMLSKEFCRRIGWFKPDGGLKDMMARVAMLAMHKDGLIALPAPQGRQNRPGPIVFGPDTEAPLFPAPTTLDKVRPLDLRPVVRGTRESKLWNEFVSRYHYLGYKTLVGAQMRYAVHDRNGWPLAMLGFSTAAWKLAPRDNFIGWTRQLREKNLPFVVDNPRFLILPWIKIPNLGSHILALIRRRLPEDWTERYNTTPVLIETFVETPRYTGAVYRASGWIHVGATQGRGRYDRDRQSDKPKKDVWLRPLRRDWKRTLNR